VQRKHIPGLPATNGSSRSSNWQLVSNPGCINGHFRKRLIGGTYHI
jgi:hypothetical protein